MNIQLNANRSGWKVADLGEVAEVVGGKPAPQSKDAFSTDGIPFVRMRDLGRYHLTSNLTQVDDRIDRAFAGTKRLKPIPKGSILLPRSGSVALNHRAILGVDAIIVSHICALVPDLDAIDNRFLYYYLRTVTLEKITKKTTGLDAINFEDLRKLPIPVPPLDVQRSIACILDKANSIRERRQSAISYVDEFLKSEFVSRFGSPQSNSKGLPKRPIKDIASVVTGNTPPRKVSENYGDQIEWIKSDNINTPSHFLTQAIERLSERGREIGRVAPKGSTLVTCIAGSPRVIGNAALANRDVAFNQQINAMIPHEHTDPFFLYCQVLVGKSLIQAASTNSMKGMVSKGKFQEIEFLAPDQDEQADFGRFFLRAIKMSQNLQADLESSEELFQSLSQRAFRGEL
ncbi:restriction endonuclease subunit S [Primorskyibacter sp. 2E233]|uniref:restriction endonuclease subunit S n=1 Tax=Primorskyibacter sp. 2E233 TaxID=3413431 RepID=UPI003BF3B0EA